MIPSVTVRAPSSTANLGPGFDVFGLALDAFYDQVKISKKGKGIKIISSDPIPINPQKNTAGLVAKKMGIYLASIKSIPDLIISSTALRAKTTAKLADKEGKWNSGFKLESGIYGGNPLFIIKLIHLFVTVDQLRALRLIHETIGRALRKR